MELPIVFVMGLSGAGKSTLGGYIHDDINFLHLEQDIPGENGIDKAGIRIVWNRYLELHDSVSLSEALRRMAQNKGKAGIVLTFDSQVSFSLQDMATAKEAGIIVVLLDGSDEDCMNSFLKRETASPTKYDEKHWHDYNDSSLIKFQGLEYDEYRIKAFEKHDHVSPEYLIESIKQKIAKNS